MGEGGETGVLWPEDRHGESVDCTIEAARVADLHLIAAAPDLLDACGAMLRMLDAYGYGSIPANEVGKMRAAVAKAMEGIVR